jgi:proteasome lid subunit RPN8/RPN11
MSDSPVTPLGEPTTLPARAYAAIVAHSRAGKPEEVCGILRGVGLAAYAAIPGRNIAAERIENYEVDPQTLLRQFEFEDAGEAMMGIYHSHPVSVAYPSATDAWNAHYPDALYFICSLEHDDAPVVRAFRMTPHFLELDYAALRDGLGFYETRPGLWGYFQPQDRALPPALANLGVTAPFYVVCAVDGDGAIEGRVVEIVEHPVVVTPG